MRNKLMTLCALTVCVPALAFAQAGGGAGGGGAGAGAAGGGNANGAAAQNTPRTQQQRQRDSLILHQRAVHGDTGQGDRQGYHGTQALTTPPHENMGTQSDTGQANAARSDTGTANSQGQQGQSQQGQSQQGQSQQATSQQGSDTVTSSAAGAIAPAGNQGLRKSDVKKLQTALDSLGCNAGPKDGIIGPKTQKAISCGEQQTNTSSLQELGQKLNVNVSGNAGASASDTTGAGMQSSPGTNAVKPNKPRQTSGQNAGRIRPIPKSKSDTGQQSQSDTTGQQSQQGQQGQQGGVDTTTSKGAIDTSFNRSDTTQMNRGDTTQMNQRDTTQMNRSDTTGAGLRDTTGTQRDTTMLRDTTRMRDTTQMRDTTRMRDTSSTRMF